MTRAATARLVEVDFPSRTRVSVGGVVTLVVIWGGFIAIGLLDDTPNPSPEQSAEERALERERAIIEGNERSLQELEELRNGTFGEDAFSPGTETPFPPTDFDGPSTMPEIGSLGREGSLPPLGEP